MGVYGGDVKGGHGQAGKPQWGQGLPPGQICGGTLFGSQLIVGGPGGPGGGPGGGIGVGGLAQAWEHSEAEP